MHQTYFYKQKLTYSGINDLADDVSDNTLSHDHTEGAGGTGQKITASGLEDSASTEIRDYAQHNPFVVSGLLPQTAASLTSNITSGEGFSPDDASSRLVRVVQESAQAHTYNSEKDTYVYLHPYLDIHGGDDGFFHFEEVGNGASEPSQPDSSLKLAKVITSLTEITSVIDLRDTSPETSSKWWEELGVTELSSTADTITVSGFTAKKFLNILIFLNPSGGDIDGNITFNNDTGNNYARRINVNGSETTATTQSKIAVFAVSGEDAFGSYEILNVATEEKILSGIGALRGSTGAANAPQKRVLVAKWANTSDSITRVDITNAQAGSYGEGSKVIVLGHD